MTSKKKKPLELCPFCETETILKVAIAVNFRRSVICTSCGTIGPSETTKESAEELWNLRRKDVR
jgi:transcription elongation factor Elf1